MRFPFLKQVAWCLIVVMTVFGFVPRVEAAFEPSKLLMLSQEERSADMGKVQAVLENKMVKERLETLGYSYDDIQSKLSQLGDQDLHRLATSLDNATVGGDGWAVIGVVAIIVLIVVAVLYFMNKKVVVREK
jgi:hypothetical protein